jgi:CubicO group peptidase (beta-lactamase class C family)
MTAAPPSRSRARQAEQTPSQLFIGRYQNIGPFVPPVVIGKVSDLDDLKLPAYAGHFDLIMQRWMAAHGVTRGSLAVMCECRLVSAAGYGGRGVNERVPLWSLSKAITALSIASLIREGKLRLDDPIGPHLSHAFAEFGQPADDRLGRITVAQLLSQRSGIPRATDDNLFAPGLVQLLRECPLRAAKIEMLMPRILESRLSRDSGVAFEYTNMGYLLLGQIIEALAVERYEEACAIRVLAIAGITNPRLDADWGGIMQAAGGWALSGPEYLAFIRLLHLRPPRLFTDDVAEFLCAPDGKWMDAKRTTAYTLGVVIESPGPIFLHSGGHNWKQDDAASGPIDEARGTSFVLLPDGTAWFASYDGLSAGTNPQATSELHQALTQACENVRPCGAIDNFPGLGIGHIWC